VVISGILDNVIALVVIILVLSLVVQSVQQALKKLFKIKSRQIEESLLDLLETVLAKRQAAGRATCPILDLLPFRDTSLDRTDPKVKVLYTAITDEFKKLGRVSQAGKLMLDSIAKNDLLKVVRKVHPETLLAGTEFGNNLKGACDSIARVQSIIGAIKPEILTGSASTEFAALRDHLTPLVNDLSTLTSGGGVKPDLLVEHILDLREIALADTFGFIAKVQDSVQQQASSATGQDKADLEKVTASLGDLSSALSNLRQNADAALVPLRAKIGELDSWFDTVMHSFDERYSRGMKTWGLVVAFLVVLIMNANVFDIYQKISGNEQVRSNIIQSTSVVQQKLAAVQAPEPSGGQPPDTTVKDLSNAMQSVLSNVDLFKSLQFQPLTWNQLQNGWNNPLKTNLKILLGWILMTMLLSVGAPFWEDTLESLFGVKNLLRQKGSVQNVEVQSGKGNPQS
jgi:hypothetical protein